MIALDCGCVVTDDDRLCMCAEHFLELLDEAEW